MIKLVGLMCAILASSLDIASYYRQISKTLRTKRSSQVSTTSYLFKISKSFPAMVGLSIYKNWIGLGMELTMLVVYFICLIIISHYKPKEWRLF